MPTDHYRHLQQYRGPLDARQLAEGMRAAIRNAQRLYEDACFMFDRSRYPTATALAILCLEEAGKVRILRFFPWARDETEMKEHWEGFRKHTAKTVDAARRAFPGNPMDIAREWKERGAPPLTLEFLQSVGRQLSANVAESRHLPWRFEWAKQLALYVDCLSRSGSAGPVWSEPTLASDRERAQHYLEVARKVVPVHSVEDREVELWVKYLRQVANSVQGDPKGLEDVVAFFTAADAAIDGYCFELESLGLSGPFPVSLVRSFGAMLRTSLNVLSSLPARMPTGE